MARTGEELRRLQAMPLELKVALTQQRIKEWVDRFGVDGVYVSFSGGKDSTVLLDVVRKMYGNDVQAVFVDTGLEYPEVRTFAKSKENVITVRPKQGFVDVIKNHGYPIIGKEIAQTIREAKIGLSRSDGSYQRAIMKITGTGACAPSDGKKNRYDMSKYGRLLNADFAVSEKCCHVMKKHPCKEYERRTKRKPITATMACESSFRKSNWLRNGCNIFDSPTRQISNPMSFWTEQDVLQYIHQNSIQIADVYGSVCIYGNCKMKTTGCERTGCIFCGFGAHLDKGESRFERLKRTHPKQYTYCLNGGRMTMTVCGSRQKKGSE